MLSHNKALHFEATDQDERGVHHGRRFAIVAGDHAAHRHSAKGIHLRKDHITDPATHVFKKAINALRRGFFQSFVQRFGFIQGFVVDTGVKAQFVDHIRALLCPARNAHHSATARFGEHAHCAAYRARSGINHHRLASFRFTNFEQAIPSCDARHAHRTKVRGQRHWAVLYLAQSAHSITIDDAVLLPAAHAHHFIAHCIFGMARFNHLADRAANHHLANGLRCRIAFGIVHSPAHVRIKAQVMVLHEHLAFLQSWQRFADQFEVRNTGFFVWAIV